MAIVKGWTTIFYLAPISKKRGHRSGSTEEIAQVLKEYEQLGFLT